MIPTIYIPHIIALIVIVSVFSTITCWLLGGGLKNLVRAIGISLAICTVFIPIFGILIILIVKAAEKKRQQIEG